LSGQEVNVDMQKVVDWTPEGSVHSKIHAKGIEHQHIKYNDKVVKLTIEFDETKVYGIIPLIGHEPDINFGFMVPDVKDGKPELSFRANYIREDDHDPKFGTYINEPTDIQCHTWSIIAAANKKASKEAVVLVNLDEEIDAVKGAIKFRSPSEENKALMAAALQKYEEEVRAAKKELNAKRAAYDIKQKEEADLIAKKEADEEAAKQKELHEIRVWAAEHGSDRLKKGLEAGYSCKKLYFTERGREDLGEGYVLDYDESIKTKDRSCPSLEALEEEARINALYPESSKIVWCPNGLDEEEYEGGCEAVEVLYLGQLYYKHTGD